MALAEERTRRKGEGNDAWDKGMGNYFASVFMGESILMEYL